MSLYIAYARPAVFLFAILLATVEFLVITLNSTSTRIQIIHLTQIYALTSVIFLYFALLASPLYTVFPHMPTRILHLKARKAIGVSAFFFALLHALIAFFVQLGGFEGLGYLSNNYLLAIIYSFTALLILSMMALTSLNYFVVKLGKYWKPLHRFVYLASMFVIVHALMLGTHFRDLSKVIPQLFFYALLILLLLEAYRIDVYIKEKLLFIPRYLVFFVLAVGIGMFSYYFFFDYSQYQSFLSVHNQHKSMQGQKAATGRFQVKLLSQNQLTPNQDTTLRFEIFDKEKNESVKSLMINYEKILHLIVVDSSLEYFVHLHPQRQGTEFSITTRFPKSDTYHLYFNYQPLGLQEQQSSLILDVGSVRSPSISNQPVDSDLTKTFGQYEVTLRTNGELDYQKMATGKQVLTFSLKDARKKDPIRDLSPYLGAFGHLVMINQETYDYIHVHPNTVIPPQPTDKGGPDIQFIPLALNTPIKSGTYRMFAQFNHKGDIFVVNYTVKVY